MRLDKLPFGEFAQVQPSVQLERGTPYAFIAMEDVEPRRRNVSPGSERIWDGGGGARFENGDVLFARITPCLEHGKTSLVESLPGGAGFGSTEFFVFRERAGISDSRYIYYLSCSDALREPAIKSMIGASGRQRAQRTVVEESLVPAPPLSVQKKVAGILSAYDDLIENNRRRMALLEEAARQLYREWFVRLRFPGHEHTRITNGAPDGWKAQTLGDCVTLNYGKALKAEDRVEGPCPVYGSSGIVGMHDKALATAPGIVVGRKGNVGSVFWCPKDYWPIDTAYFIDAATSNLWLFYALQCMHFISTDVAVPGLNRDIAYSRPLLVPEPRIVRDFLANAVPLHEQITKLDDMNEKLRAARDLMLPRLMTGEIAV